jgi:hypothetical protein
MIIITIAVKLCAWFSICARIRELTCSHRSRGQRWFYVFSVLVSWHETSNGQALFEFCWHETSNGQALFASSIKHGFYRQVYVRWSPSRIYVPLNQAKKKRATGVRTWYPVTSKGKGYILGVYHHGTWAIPALQPNGPLTVELPALTTINICVNY